MWDTRHLNPSQQRARFKSVVSGSWTGFDSTLWELNITHSNLLRRRWVLQERILSARVLYFTGSHAFFEY